MYEINKSLNLINYSDSNYASNKLNRKLILNYYYMLGERSVF